MLFFTGMANAQSDLPYTNNTDKVWPLLADFMIEAELRGFDFKERILELDSIIVSNRGTNEYRWSGNVETIELDEKELETEWLAIRNFTHELGHHLGLKHCEFCSFSFMAAIKWSGLVRDYSNPIYKGDFYDHFFKALGDVKEYNGHTKHY